MREDMMPLIDRRNDGMGAALTLIGTILASLPEDKKRTLRNKRDDPPIVFKIIVVRLMNTNQMVQSVR
jgi:hypothetical protein